MAKRNIDVTWDKKAVEHIALKSHDPKQGARLVRRSLQDLVELGIAQKLLNHPTNLMNGQTVDVKIKAVKDKIDIELRVPRKNKKAN